MTDYELFVVFPQNHTVALLDWKYWSERESDLDTWCEENLVTRRGMWLACPDERALTAFVLKWK